MKKKYLFLLVIILILIGSFLFFILFNRPVSWDKMQIKDFKIYSYKDRWENYPFPAEKINLELIESIIPNTKQNVDKIESYQWKTNNKVYAFIYIIQLKNELSNFKSTEEVKSNQEEISKEQVYVYTIPIDYEGTKENMKVFLFDENRFVFIAGGFWDFPEELVKKLVNKYPSKPTISNLNINSEFVNQLNSII
jgi:hypothetical protein